MINNILFEDNDTIVCDVCDAEFIVESSDSEAEVSFCPFCGNDLEIDDAEDDESIYE